MDNQTADALAALAERVARLEAAAMETSSPRATPFPFDLGDSADADLVTYSGHGTREGDPIAWQTRRTWKDVLEAAGEGEFAGDGIAAALNALASGPRLRIVAELVHGAVATGNLAERLGQSGASQGSTGQLFHHLKELLAAGIVHQPQRGVYAIRPAHVVPLLTVLSAAMDLTHNTSSIPQQEGSPS
ncbi:MAG: winged helix-turn-helix transcriptional regulator [Demequinaceae bacterium]|nr:winged helix-turn-helix transcriptional regulator [Demequinaceae bacterium]